jgi:hypothetical protein
MAESMGPVVRDCQPVDSPLQLGEKVARVHFGFPSQSF